MEITTHNLSDMERILLQYPIVETLGDYAGSTSLFNLAKASKTCRNMLYENQTIWNKLLIKSQCSCDGMFKRLEVVQEGLRQQKHLEEFPEWWIKKSDWCQERLEDCGSRLQWTVTKPCDECNFQVCNHCRAHLAYATMIRQVQGNSNEPVQFKTRVTTLGHLVGIDPVENQRTVTLDQIVEHDSNTLIRDLHYSLDRNLYRDVRDKTFQTLINNRKRYMCIVCARGGSETLGKKNAGHAVQAAFASGIHTCSCTLRGRFLDRWVCLHCVEQEARRDASYTQNYACSQAHTSDANKPFGCSCGLTFPSQIPLRAYCGWCGGACLE